MDRKRKISIIRILQLTVTIIVSIGSVVAISAASKIQNSKKLQGIDIYIRNSQYRFIDEQEVKDLLITSKHIDLEGTPLGKINIHRMESTMASNPWVESAQAYVDNKHVLRVNIIQRVPVARIFEQDGNSYYLDPHFNTVPLSSKYIHYTTVVTNVPTLKEDSLGNALRAQIVALVKYIDRDTFWNAQISQVIMTDDLEFEVVPVLGNHRILIGDTNRMKQKFNNLFAFYNKVLNRIGWEKYELLDVRYNNQVVASPALQWKKPIDNAMANMNWVKSIIGSDTGTVESDTPTNKMVQTVTTVTASETTVAPVKTIVTQHVSVKPEPAKPKHVEVSSTQEVKKVAKPPVKKVIVVSNGTKNKKAESKKETNEQEKPAKYIYKGNNQ